MWKLGTKNNKKVWEILEEIHPRCKSQSKCPWSFFIDANCGMLGEKNIKEQEGLALMHLSHLSHLPFLLYLFEDILFVCLYIINLTSK